MLKLNIYTAFALLVLILPLISIPAAQALNANCNEAFELPVREVTTSTASFNAAKYEAFREHFAVAGVTLGDPFRTSNEELMAAIDALNVNTSRKISQPESVSFAKSFEIADGAAYDEMTDWLNQWRTHGQMTPRDINRAVARLERLLAEKTLSARLRSWVAKWNPKNLRLRLAVVSDVELIAQLRHELLTHGLIKGLQSVGAIQDTGSRAALESWYARNQDTLRYLTTTVVNAASLVTGALQYYLPQTGRTARLLRSPECTLGAERVLL